MLAESHARFIYCLVVGSFASWRRRAFFISSYHPATARHGGSYRFKCMSLECCHYGVFVPHAAAAATFRRQRASRQRHGMKATRCSVVQLGRCRGALLHPFED